jgi:hypothetical protein
VAVLADGSCAFFRARRKSQPSKQESAAQKRLPPHLPMPSPSEKGSVLTHFLDVAGVSFLRVGLFELVTQ